MKKIRESLQETLEFLNRYPNLDGSTLLKKEADSLWKALQKYNERAEEVGLSLTADFAETSSLLEGDGKNIVTPDFIKTFTRKHCSKILSFDKANKKERSELLLLAAKEKKLPILKKMIDPSKMYREMYQDIIKESTRGIEQKLLSMKPKDFQGLVNAVGLDAPRTKTGGISTSKTVRKNVLKQILRDKESDELMDALSGD